MASKGNIGMDVIVEDQTSVGLASAQKNIDNFTQRNAKSSKSLKKDWSGLGDLFSTVLPRGMQRTVRSFRSTSRSVGRLSKSFKVLKAAWASVGIGLAIIAIEQLIENWDKVTEALGFYNKEAEESKKLNKLIVESQAQLGSEMIGYLQIISDLNAEESLRAAAIERINNQLGNVIDTEASANEQREQALNLSGLALEIDKQRNLENDKRRKFREAEAAYDADSTNAEKTQAYLDAGVEVEKVTKNLLALEVELNKLITDKSEAEKEAARLKAESLRQEEANAKYLADLEKKLNEEILLNSIESEQLREEKVLELRMEEQKKKAEDAGATAAQLLLIAEDYENDLRKLRKRFTDEDEAEKLRDEAERIADNEALQEELYLSSLSDEERERANAERRYNDRLEMARGNVALLLQVQEEFLQDKENITDKYAQERLDKSQEETDEELAIKKQSWDLMVKGTRQLFGAMEELAGENAEQAKAFAIADVLLAQAVATAKAIEAAAKSANDPVSLIANIIIAVASIVSAFVGVRQLLEDAGATGLGGGGGGGVSPTAALVPEQVSRTESVGKSFVVQSDLEGANLQANQLYNQTALGGG
tara:strand:- start:5635 stop:7416 length:1782 start_codon:yes stop_codon:yes gene_type:complete